MKRLMRRSQGKQRVPANGAVNISSLNSFSDLRGFDKSIRFLLRFCVSSLEKPFLFNVKYEMFLGSMYCTEKRDIIHPAQSEFLKPTTNDALHWTRRDAHCGLAPGYPPIPIVRRFKPLSYGSSQNSLLSTTRARNYDDIILPSSYLNNFWRQQRYLNTAPQDPYFHLTPPYLHVVDDACAPHELERVGSIVTYCVNHSKRL